MQRNEGPRHFLSLSKQECEQSIVLRIVSTVGNSIIIPGLGQFCSKPCPEHLRSAAQASGSDQHSGNVAKWLSRLFCQHLRVRAPSSSPFNDLLWLPWL